MKKNIKFVISIIVSLMLCMIFMECNVFASQKVVNSANMVHVKKIVGLHETEDGTYYYNEDGSKATNKFVKYDGNKYYFGKDGKMATSRWIKTKSNKYFARSNGKIATGKVKIGGIVYNFNKDGKLISNVFEPLDYNELTWGMSKDSVFDKLDELSREHGESKDADLTFSIDVSKREADCVSGYAYEISEDKGLQAFIKLSLSDYADNATEQFMADLSSGGFVTIGDRVDDEKISGYLFYNKEKVEFAVIVQIKAGGCMMIVYDTDTSEKFINDVGGVSSDIFNMFVD